MPGLGSRDCLRLKPRAGWSINGPVARNFNQCDILLLKNAGRFILSLRQQRWEEKIELVCSIADGRAAASWPGGSAAGRGRGGRIRVTRRAPRRCIACGRARHAAAAARGARYPSARRGLSTSDLTAEPPRLNPPGSCRSGGLRSVHELSHSRRG